MGKLTKSLLRTYNETTQWFMKLFMDEQLLMLKNCGESNNTEKRFLHEFS